MAHDANFVGNRLRLSAFLQCVEHGEMPARPSRFRRCPEILYKPARSLVRLSPRVDCDVPVLEAYNEPLVLASKASTETRAIMSNVDEETAIDDEPLEINVGEEEEKEEISKGLMHVTSSYNIPQSPIAHLRLTPDSINGQESHNYSEEDQRRSKLKSISQSKRRAIPTTTIVEKTSGNIKGLSSIPKRRLPVHELALLRTTTLDGLPIPGDATVSFAIPIAVVDPIEDSQMRLAGILSNQTSRNLVITKRRLSPRITQLSNAVHSPDTRISKSTAKQFQGPSPRSTGKSQHHSGFQNAYDGFVGSELQLTPTKRPSCRRKAISIKRQKHSTMRELALGAGSLSVSADYDMAISAVLAVDKTTNLDCRLAPSRPGDTQPNSRVGQLVLTRTRSALEPNVIVEGIPN